VPEFFHFDKYEGLGNDFIVVEADRPLAPDRVTRLCDRHFGIGADGVLVVSRGVSAGSRATMIVQNADGSRPEMCGNGLRSVALHLARHDTVDRADYVVDTDAGRRRCVVERHGDTATVDIDMGRAEPQDDHTAELDGRAFSFRRVSMGNPHAICLDGLLDAAFVDRLAPSVSAGIPGGTNVEFVGQRGSTSFDVIVWERGVGRTLACGTGAAATAAALAIAGRAPFGEPIEIWLPGGPLEVSVAEGTLEVRLRGPARRVFSGDLA
jgi:diaminopimelate epimerase